MHLEDPVAETLRGDLVIAGSIRPGDKTAPRVNGKFLDVDKARFLVKGVTYGTFAPDAGRGQFPSSARIEQDFALMAANGINTVRT